jgi:transposase
MEEVDEVELHVQRVAALDLGKAALTACVRVPHQHKPGRRMQEVREYPTTTAELHNMMVWFRQWDVQRVVMESTSDYWKGVYYLLEAEGFERWLVNAREVKNTPGRAKTDKLDAVWLAKVAERGMCRPSLVHPPEIRQLRDLTGTGAPWWRIAPGSGSGWRTCSRTPRSRSVRCSPTFTVCPGGR